MAGKNLGTFQDFVKSTQEDKFTDPRELINDAVFRTYTLTNMMKGRGEAEVIRGGASITDRIQLATGSSFEFYLPNAQFTPTDEDTLTKLQAAWCFCKDSWAWTDQEIILNNGDKALMWVDLTFSKRQACEISTINGMEQALWATPNQNQMESLNNASRPYSIPAFIAENGIQPANWTTTILQADPTQLTYWRNQAANYASAAIDTTLVPAMESIFRQCRFESPESKEEYFRSTKYEKQKIYTNNDGWGTYVRLTRNSNDRNFPANDLGWATENPTFSGIPVKWVEALDAFGYAIGQPRFFFINTEYLFPVWHESRYMIELDPIPGGPTQPFSWVAYKDTWYNIFCRSRYRQGIVVPV